MGAENIENLCWLWERNGMRSHLWFIYPVSMRNKKPLGIKGDTPMMPETSSSALGCHPKRWNVVGNRSVLQAERGMDTPEEAWSLGTTGGQVARAEWVQGQVVTVGKGMGVLPGASTW